MCKRLRFYGYLLGLSSTGCLLCGLWLLDYDLVVESLHIALDAAVFFGSSLFLKRQDHVLRAELLASFMLGLYLNFHGFLHALEGVELGFSGAAIPPNGNWNRARIISSIMRLCIGLFGVHIFLQRAKHNSFEDWDKLPEQGTEITLACLMHSSLSSGFALLSLIGCAFPISSTYSLAFHSMGNFMLGVLVLRVSVLFTAKIALLFLNTTPLLRLNRIRAAARSLNQIQGVLKVYDVHFYSLTRDYTVGTLTIQAKLGANSEKIRRQVHESFEDLLSELSVMIVEGNHATQQLITTEYIDTHGPNGCQHAH